MQELFSILNWKGQQTMMLLCQLLKPQQVTKSVTFCLVFAISECSSACGTSSLFSSWLCFSTTDTRPHSPVIDKTSSHLSFFIQKCSYLLVHVLLYACMHKINEMCSNRWERSMTEANVNMESLCVFGTWCCDNKHI